MPHFRRAPIRDFHSELVTGVFVVAFVMASRNSGGACRVHRAQCGGFAFHILLQGEELTHFDINRSTEVFAIYG